MKYSNLSDLLIFLKFNSSKNIFLWGAGALGIAFGQLLNNQGIRWAGYYDNFCDKEEVNGKPVYQGFKAPLDYSAIYVITIRDFYQIKNQLLELGIAANNIVCLNSSEIINKILNSTYNQGIFDKLIGFSRFHQGQSCFIVGNGPSLEVSDIEKIGKYNITSLTSNYFHRCYDKTDYRSDYHFWSDATIIRELALDRNYLVKILSDCRNLFTPAQFDFNKFYNDDDLSNIVFYNRVLGEMQDFPSFSTNGFENIYAGGGSVTYEMIQIAVYMGFTKIFLIGVDHTSSFELLADGSTVEHPDVQDHALMFGSYKKTWMPSPLYRVENAYISAKRYCDPLGIKIYNATRGGKLEVFPRVNLDDILG